MVVGIVVVVAAAAVVGGLALRWFSQRG